jgi:uncharacterized protein YidB (DUF937 family)
MGLFDQVVGALNNPNQEASSDQLSSILGVVGQISGSQGLDAGSTQKLLTVVGQHVRGALQEKRQVGGQSLAESLVTQFSGTQANPESVQSLFSQREQAETVQDAANKTGIDTQTIQSLLPLLIPVVLKFLQQGNTKQAGSGGNSVLSTFLDSDNDGDFDIGDAMSVASRFLK